MCAWFLNLSRKEQSNCEQDLTPTKLLTPFSPVCLHQSIHHVTGTLAPFVKLNQAWKVGIGIRQLLDFRAIVGIGRGSNIYAKSHVSRPRQSRDALFC